MRNFTYSADTLPRRICRLSPTLGFSASVLVSTSRTTADWRLHLFVFETRSTVQVTVMLHRCIVCPPSRCTSLEVHCGCRILSAMSFSQQVLFSQDIMTSLITLLLRCQWYFRKLITRKTVNFFEIIHTTYSSFRFFGETTREIFLQIKHRNIWINRYI